jgi:CheY-like chemotaxis protein/signal transduction histidine kinase
MSALQPRAGASFLPVQRNQVTDPQPSSPGKLASFFREGRRRKVWTTAAAYLALSIAAIELSDAVAAALLFPDWTQRLVTFLLILGFPIVLAIAWIFDIGPGGSFHRTQPESTNGGGGQGERKTTSTASERTPSTPVWRRDRKPLPAATPAPPVQETAEAEPPGEVDSTPPDPHQVRRAALAHVRHELRTPINAILGYSELILEEDPGPELEPDLRRIIEAGSTLLGLVDRILNPAQLTGDITRDLESYAEEVRVELRTPVNSVIGYAELLMEAEEEAGRETHLSDLERIRTSAQALLADSGDIVSVALAAPGPTGTPEATLDALGVSSRLAESVLSSIKHSGVGARRSPEGEGSLLVVDDNATSRDLLARQLAGHGYIVDTAENGAQALERARSGAFDMILLDVIMPVMDGVETLRRLKGDERLRDIPVVMLSSLDETDGALRCLEMGAEEYLAKPVPSRLLEARIAANLTMRRLREHTSLLRERIKEDEALLDRLMGQAFPSAAAERMSAGADYRETVSQASVLILRLDPGDASGDSDPERYLARLSELCAAGGAEAAARGMDAYATQRDGFVVAVAGTPDAPGDPQELGDLALSLMGTGEDGRGWRPRGALHMGPVVAAIVGGQRPRFDVWGEAVETAGLLAAQADPGTVLVSPTARTLLSDPARLQSVGVAEVPGRGRMKLHSLRPHTT